MLSPKRMKYRKAFKGRIKGQATGGNKITFGEFALQALEPGKITSRQIEAARIALTRHMKRGGRVWIKIFPYKPVSKKPLEVRMGAGKGSVEFYVAPIRTGRIIYEIGSEVEPQVAREALELAAAKLPIRTRVIAKSDVPWG
jgi:large subunit ribosomal protein L16